MIKAKAEGNKITVNIHSSVDSYASKREDDDKDAVANVDQLKEILNANKDAAIIDVFINSPGGDVMEGIGIYNILKRHRAYKRIYIDGFACSIASVIAMAGNAIYMPKSSLQMIHNAWIFAMGNANELRKMADDLDKVNETIVNAYMSRFTGTRDELQTLLDNETYLTAEECLKYGLCTKVVDNSEDTEESVEEGIVDITNAYAAQLDTMKRIRDAITNLNAESATDEDVNEAKAEMSEEIGADKEAIEQITSTTVEKEEVVAQVEAVKLNALQKFFHINGETK